MDPAGRFPPPAPYPRRRSAISLMGAVVGPHSNEGITSVVRRRSYCFRRCKKVEASNIESLPNEVLSEILVRLSADEIFEKARFVSRNWYRIIHNDAFVNTHLNRHGDDWGLLLSSLYYDEQPLFLGVRQGRIELSNLYHKIFFPVSSSCNGLALSYTKSSKSIQLVNLATKQAFSFPPSLPRGQGIRCTFGMAYAAASMEYKVVRTYTACNTPTFCHILTAGVDNNWRSVRVDNLSCGAKKLLLKAPLITQGFMHWTWELGGTRVLTLNVETEMFTESYVPLLPHPVDDDDDAFAYEKTRRCKIFASTGRRLCLFSAPALVYWLWEVWEMEGESGEWKKLLPDINLGAHMRKAGGIIMPLGWVKYPVFLALRYGSTCIVYNLSTDKIDCTITLPHPCLCYRAVVHRNTLEWLS